MKFKSGLLLLLALMFTTSVHAQESAAESVERLRMQLLDLQAREEDLKARLQDLEESLKPENIERSLAGVGSTRPEELRESRRRQLTIQRDGMVAQLKLLETGRQRLETAIANAEAKAYQESARPQMFSASVGSGYQWLMLGGGGFAALALVGGVVLYRRKIRLRS